MNAEKWFKNLPDKCKDIVKQAQLSRDPTGNMNLNISPEVQELIKRFGIAAGASLIPNGIINAMRGDKLLHNALPVAAVSGGAYAAYPQVMDKLKGLKDNYMSRYNDKI